MKTKAKNSAVAVNPEQRLYVIPHNYGYSCHGFDVVERLIASLIKEGLRASPDIPPGVPGTPERYAYYRALCANGLARNARTGWRSGAELTPELIGKEGRRVEVTHKWPSGKLETIRFQVGKSTGWMPCHLQLARRGVSGGPAVCLGEVKSVRVIS